ncbi:MAG: hypothetical protein AAB639_03710 [Patescibacteria group bacterium]
MLKKLLPSQLEKALLFVNLAIYGLLAIFSYAYVDLNLTISQNPTALKFVQTMQQLGYFNRPSATWIYLGLIIFTFSFFIFNLWLFYKSKVGQKYLTISTVTNTAILIFAYPFLSSDLFNYLFDAKIILNYHASPYTHRPLDFPNDEWLRFMRWIHRYSPYGPLWLGSSLIPAALGFGKFIANFLTFKLFIAAFHLINSYLIFKILSKINTKAVLIGTAFYALNPLFLIEGVANAHNDSIVATTMLASIYFLVQDKKVLSYLLLSAGAGIKYIPILNLPWLVLATQKFLGYDRLILANLITMAIFTYLYSSFRITVPFVSSGATQVQFQPWYLFWTLPFVATVPRVPLLILAIAVCIGASARYLPYLYYGDWSQPGTITFMQLVTIAPPILALAVLLAKNLIAKSEKN